MDLEYLETILKPGVSMEVRVSSDIRPLQDKCLAIRADVLRELSECNELSLSLKKRFKGKTTRHGTPDYASLVLWCLASLGYRVNSAYIASVMDEDVVRAWEFIDTLKVSSGSGTRELLSRCLKGRDGVSFRRSCPPAGVPKRTIKMVSNPEAVFSNPTALGCNSTTLVHPSLKQMMFEDACVVALRSDDPLGTAVSMFRHADIK